MSAFATPQTKDSSTRSNLEQEGDDVRVELFQHPAGEGNCYYSDTHTLCLSLSPRPVRLLHVRDGKSYTGLYSKGDLMIAPVEMPFFARWDGDDRYLQIRIASRFIQRVAREALDVDGDRLQLVPEFRTRDSQIEAIGMMLLTELQQGKTGSKLYVESLANVLAIYLIRQYTTTPSSLPIYKGGLPQRQLLLVLEYIDVHLHQEIRLMDLAALLDVSAFHFSRQFKQSMGIAPYQYLLQQRIERAKQLLKQSDRPITDVAFQCGFNSHSHLSKQFRQMTGMTPSAYRAK